MDFGTILILIIVGVYQLHRHQMNQSEKKAVVIVLIAGVVAICFCCIKAGVEAVKCCGKCCRETDKQIQKENVFPQTLVVVSDPRQIQNQNVHGNFVNFDPRQVPNQNINGNFINFDPRQVPNQTVNGNFTNFDPRQVPNQNVNTNFQYEGLAHTREDSGQYTDMYDYISPELVDEGYVEPNPGNQGAYLVPAPTQRAQYVNSNSGITENKYLELAEDADASYLHSSSDGQGSGGESKTLSSGEQKAYYDTGYSARVEGSHNTVAGHGEDGDHSESGYTDRIQTSSENSDNHTYTPLKK